MGAFAQGLIMARASEWLYFDADIFPFLLISIVGGYVTLITLTRLFGIRSFSKMSGFDFAVTVAIGSIFASIIISKSVPLLQGLTTLAILYSLQIGFAWLRSRVKWMQKISDNQPRLVMIGDEIQHDQLRKAKMTHSDLMSKLREANVINFSEIKVVIAETTGDISVLHQSDVDSDLTPDLLEGVIGAERFFN